MTDKKPAPKMQGLPDEGKYGAPSAGLFEDVLGPATRTAEFKAAAAKKKHDDQQALRDKLEEQSADDLRGLRARFDARLKPVLEALTGLAPDAAGKAFTLEVALSGGVEDAVKALDESLYRGPSLTAVLRYGAPGAAGDGSGVAPRPELRIDIRPSRFGGDEEIEVTRCDIVEPAFYDQGGAGPNGHARRKAYSYADVRNQIGDWLGQVAPERIPDLAAAAKATPPAPPRLRGGPKIKLP